MFTSSIFMDISKISPAVVFSISVKDKYPMRLFELFPRLLRESFTDISVAKLGIDALVKQADANLGDEAGDAIEAFIGVPHDAIDKGYSFGIMHSRQLEDAYSTAPSQQGVEIRRQLDSAFAPIRAALKSKFGDVMTLYRGQENIDNEKPDRNTLSWTSDPRIAATFTGITPQEMKLKPITDDQIEAALKIYQDTGKVEWLRQTYVRTDNPTNDATADEFYYDIHERNGEYVTDGDDLRQQFKDDQEWYQELIDKRTQGLKKVITAEIPIDDIIWISDRAGQSEFILHNRPGAQGYIDAKGKLIK